MAGLLFETRPRATAPVPNRADVACFIGLVPLRDAETGERLLVDTSDPGLRARHRALALAAEAALREDFGRAGVDAVEIACDEDPVDALAGYLRLRRLHARLRSGAASAIAAANSAGGARALPVA